MSVLNLQDQVDQYADERKAERNFGNAQARIDRDADREQAAKVARYQAELAAGEERARQAQATVERIAAARLIETPQHVAGELRAFLAEPKQLPQGPHISGGTLDILADVRTLRRHVDLLTRFVYAVERQG